MTYSSTKQMSKLLSHNNILESDVFSYRSNNRVEIIRQYLKVNSYCNLFNCSNTRIWVTIGPMVRELVNRNTVIPIKWTIMTLIYFKVYAETKLCICSISYESEIFFREININTNSVFKTILGCKGNQTLMNQKHVYHI